MSIFPLYYFPPNSIPPAHIRRARPVVQLLAGVAPDAIPEEERGGRIVGESPDAFPQMMTSKLWKKSRFGWWCILGDVTPESLHRVDATPGSVITGLQRNHRWHIPALVTYETGRGYCSALQPVYLDGEWRIPSRFRDLIDRLVNVFIRVLGDAEPTNDEKLALAVEILSINYHITIAELEHFEWLTPDLCWKICACTIKTVGEEQTKTDAAALVL